MSAAKKTTPKRKAAAKKKTAPKRKPAAKKPAPKKLEPAKVPETMAPENPQETAVNPELVDLQANQKIGGPSGIGEAPPVVLPEFEPELRAAGPEGPEPSGTAPAENAPGRLTKDQFFELFRGLFAAPNIYLARKGQKPLQALHIASENEAARAASDATYEICEEIEALRWMLEPGNKWAQRALIIGTFTMGVWDAAVWEYRMNNAQPVDDGKPDSPPSPDPVPEPKHEAPETPERAPVMVFETEIDAE